MTPDANAQSEVDLVVNPAANNGKGIESIDHIIEVAARAGTELVLHTSPSPSEARTLVAGLVSGGTERVIVAGGDGMVHLAIQELAGSRCELGIVGIGTGNDFATAIGLPRDAEGAVRAALGQAVPVDAIAVGGSWAATVVTFGFSATVNERAESMRFPRGASKYTVATLLELPRMKPSVVELTVDGTTHEVDAAMVAIANTSMFGGGMKIAPGASHADGLLDVVVIGNVGRLTLARMLPTVFSGGHLRHKEVRLFRGAEVAVGSSKMAVRADGEAFGALPLTAKAVKGALMIAGASSATNH